MFKINMVQFLWLRIIQIFIWWTIWAIFAVTIGKFWIVPFIVIVFGVELNNYLSKIVKIEMNMVKARL